MPYRAAQNEPPRGRLVHPMTDADEQRPDPVLRPNHLPDALPLMQQGAEVAPRGTRRLELPDKQALRAADRWKPAEDPQVGSDPEPPRMREALPVEHQHVRAPRQ